MSRPWPVLITLTFLSSSFAVCDSCRVAGEDQDGVNCTFQSDACGWNITSGDGVSWRRNNGFMLWETEKTVGAEEGFFSSKQLCFTENRIYSLEFKYRINLASVCSLSVKLQCAQATRDPVWVRDHKAGNWWLTSPPLNISCPDSTFKIVFLAKKNSTPQRLKCLIRVDDIVYKYSGKDISSSSTTTTSTTALATTALSEDVFQPSTATATVTPTTDFRIQPTSREAEGTTAGTSTHKTTDGYADANDSDNGLAIGLGVSVAAVAVVILVVVVIIVIIRRGGSDGNNGGCTGILNRRRKKQEPDTTPDILKLGETNSTYSHEMPPENDYLRRDRVNPMSQGVSGSHDAAARRPNICVTSSGYVEMENGSFSERSRDCGGSGYITLDDAADSTDNQDPRQARENMYEHLVPVDGHTYSKLQSTENEYERLAPADTRTKNVYSMPQFKQKESK